MKTEGGEGDKADDKRVITESDESTSSKEGERYDGSGCFQLFSEKMVAADDFISIASGVLSAGLEARETPNTVPMKDASFQTSVVSYESPNNSNALDQLISKHGFKLENGEGENSKKEGDGEDKNSKSENTLIDMGQWIEAMGSDNWGNMAGEIEDSQNELMDDASESVSEVSSSASPGPGDDD